MKLKAIICTILLLISTVAVFHQVSSFGYVDYDDPAYIVNNPYVNSGIDSQNIIWAFTHSQSKGITSHQGVENLWHPLTWLSHMLDVQVFGLDAPEMHHLMNLTIHTLTGLCVFLFFGLLLKNLWVAFFTAALFLIHPLHVESVAWLSERKDTLSALFLFISLSFYVVTKPSKSLVLTTLSVGFFLLALLAKPSVVILPGLLVLIDSFRKDFSGLSILDWFKKQLLHKLPWILPAVAVSAITLYLQTAGSHSYFASQSSLTDRLTEIPLQLCYYLYRMILPVDLSFHYVQPSFLASSLALAICLALIIGSILLSLALRKSYPLFGFAVYWFLICLVPVSGIIYVGSSFTADRYSYLAIIGFFALVSHLITQGLPEKPAVTVLSVLTLTCGYLSFQQTKVWKNSYSLFENAIKSQPSNTIGYVNLAAKHKQQGEPNKAIPILKKVIKMQPAAYIAHHNLASIYQNKKKLTLASQSYQKALQAYPDYVPSHAKLAEIFIEKKQYTKALKKINQCNALTNYRNPSYLLKSVELNLSLNHKAVAEKQLKQLILLPNKGAKMEASIVKIEQYLGIRQ